MTPINLIGPLVVTFIYFDKNTDNTDNRLSVISLAEAITAFQAMMPSLSAQLDILLPFSSEPLPALMTTAWQASRASEQNSAESDFTKRAGAGGTSVTNVGAAFPPTGVLSASTADTSPGTHGTLNLYYDLPGCSISFDTGSITAEWCVYFNAKIVVAASVPARPFSISSTTTVELSNADTKPENLVADAEAAVLTFINELTDGHVSTVSQTVERGVDGANAPAQIMGVGTLFDDLNNLSPSLKQAGFTECFFGISVDSQLLLTIKHPLDPAPTVEDDNGYPPGTLTIHPTITATEYQVLPGAKLEVTGNNFLQETADRFSVRWANTSSGRKAGAEVRFGVDGSSTTKNELIPAPSGDYYRFTAEGLKADTDYAFQTRCSDALTWGAWSKVFRGRTARNDLIQLTLQNAHLRAESPAVDIGQARLSASSGSWTTEVTIPGGTPAGIYNVRALSSESDGDWATMQITVVDHSVPRLDIVDQLTGDVISQPVIEGGSAYRLRGRAFPNGIVEIRVTGEPIQLSVSAGGQFAADLHAPGNPLSAGTVTVAATAPGASAETTFFMPGQSK